MAMKHAVSRSLGAVALAATLTVGAAAEERVKAVASFSILADLTRAVGGDRVEVSALVGPDEDAHGFTPTPQDAARLASADMLVVNGLNFEPWADRMVEAAGFSGVRVVASHGVSALPGAHEDHGGEKHDDHGDEKHDDHGHEGHADAAKGAEKHEDHDAHDHDAHDHDAHDHGGVDPHAWQDPHAVERYVAEIAEGLTEADPAGAAYYAERRDAYLVELDALDAEIRALFADIPPERRLIVTSHDAFQFFGAAYDLRFLAVQGFSSATEPSAKEIAELIALIRSEGVTAFFPESFVDRRPLEQVARETGATIGAPLYPGALSGPEGPAPTYLAMMRHNAATIAAALRGE